jgi:hypothetical protein
MAWRMAELGRVMVSLRRSMIEDMLCDVELRERRDQNRTYNLLSRSQDFFQEFRRDAQKRVDAIMLGKQKEAASRMPRQQLKAIAR